MIQGWTGNLIRYRYEGCFRPIMIWFRFMTTAGGTRRKRNACTPEGEANIKETSSNINKNLTRLLQATFWKSRPGYLCFKMRCEETDVWRCVQMSTISPRSNNLLLVVWRFLPWLDLWKTKAIVKVSKASTEEKCFILQFWVKDSRYRITHPHFRHRKRHVEKSKVFNITVGVPQRSILDPLEWNIKYARVPECPVYAITPLFMRARLSTK